MLYAAFFREGNFRLPMSKFLGEILSKYDIHISQVNALGLPRVTILSLSVLHKSWSQRLKCSIRDPSKSFDDWKQKFFYIRRVVIPIDMHYRTESEGVPKVVVAGSYAYKEWYKTVTRRPTPIIQLEEKALVSAGMSLMWVPREPTAFPVYAYKGKGYSLINVFDLKVGGEIATALLPEGEPAWTARIRDSFLHPSSESVASYGTVILGTPFVAEADLGKSPTREGTILLLSEESTSSSHGLIRRSSRAGPQQRPVPNPEGAASFAPPIVNPVVTTTEPKRKEAEKEKIEKRESEKKSAEEPSGAQTRKRFSKVELLDYVVVSNPLSGLDAGIKGPAPDADDQATLTEMMAKKQKIVSDKKQELDDQAALALSEKKLKVMGHTSTLSDSEVDLRVSAKKPANLLEWIYEASSQPRSMRQVLD
ncbi:hypothetical protein HanOQP8_Chr10g0358001 [Helianthus annuus]|nr:hypothetical protein HanOQP8_Chr10g0358001 [Helianthus annuus]KAJ0882954.1 hypothetical protein HanPSC8_Chr10g0415651 [Helianthus annuus]